MVDGDPKRLVWDAYRFYTFFWLWAAPAYWLISDDLENGWARRDAGLSPPYLFFTLVFLSILAGCYFLLNLRSGPPSDLNGDFTDSLSGHHYDKVAKSLAIFLGYGAFVCAVTSWASGFVVYDFVYPDDPSKRLSFPIERETFIGLCVGIIGNFGLYSLYKSARYT